MFLQLTQQQQQPYLAIGMENQFVTMLLQIFELARSFFISPSLLARVRDGVHHPLRVRPLPPGSRHGDAAGPAEDKLSHVWLLPALLLRPHLRRGQSAHPAGLLHRRVLRHLLVRIYLASV